MENIQEEPGLGNAPGPATAATESVQRVHKSAGLRQRNFKLVKRSIIKEQSMKFELKMTTLFLF